MKDYFRNLFSYKWQSGMIAWLMMRISGLVIFVFLCVHLVSVNLAKEKSVFLRLTSLKSHPGIRLLELLLIFLFDYHGMNGVRLLLPGAERTRSSTVFSLALGATFLFTIWFWKASAQ